MSLALTTASLIAGDADGPNAQTASRMVASALIMIDQRRSDAPSLGRSATM
jgi:hypothetical protein